MSVIVPIALIAAALGPVIGSPASAAPVVPGDKLASTFPIPTRAAPGADKPTYDAHAVLVKLRGTASAQAKQKAVSRNGRSASAVAAQYVRVTSAAPAPALLRQLQAEPAVELAQLDYHRKLTASPNDEYFRDGSQNYLSSLRLQSAWDISRSAGTQTIAILDTGIDLGHPDLAGRIVGSYNAVAPGESMADPISHGTFVAGVAAATTNNAAGVAGAAWTARLLPVKVFDGAGDTTDAILARGIDWARTHGARIINMSLGGPGDGAVLHDAVKRATASGVLVVASAGNTSEDTIQYPAGYPEALAVAATDWNGSVTYFSTRGDWVDIAAPGWDIGSTYPRPMTPAGFTPYSFGGAGTSFSAPMVAGVAALVRNRYPTLTPGQTIARLKTTARDAGPRGLDPYYGAGFLDANNALGGRWAADLAPGLRGANEPNDLPARATAMTTSATGVLSTEGDVDWYRVESSAPRNVTITMKPPLYDDENRPQNVDAVLTVHNNALRLLGSSDGEDPAATETVVTTLAAGRSYIAVNNFNGSRDSRPYTLTVANAGAGSAVVGDQQWLTNTSPPDLALGISTTVSPVISVQRALDGKSVTTSTVRLLNGRTGAVVPSTVTFNAVGKTITLNPTATLQDNTPYRISVGAVHDITDEVFQGYSSTFRTVDVAPTAPTGFSAVGGYLSATLRWALPPVTDLDQVIVRRAAGTTPPSSPTTGTAVYAGTGTSTVATGLAGGTTYTFRAWAKDRSGKLSTPVTTRLVGTRVVMSKGANAIYYGGSVRITGKLTRVDTGAALAGTPMTLYARQINSSHWRVLTQQTSSSTGTVSYVHTPGASNYYSWGYNGSSVLLGSRPPNALVEVRPTITAFLSPTAFALGGSTSFYGYVRTPHAGRTVYLQRWVNGTWGTTATMPLTSTGNFNFRIKPTVRGIYLYRLVFLADADHSTNVSASKRFTVS